MPWRSHEIRLFGHRGASAIEPENTVEAFDRALADGATALELDVHLSRDGHVMVAHDPDGRRMAGEDKQIRHCTRSELGRWNMAARHRGASARTASMPSLDEILDRFDRVPISVDLKPDDRRIAPAVLEVVRAHEAEDRVTVGSFHGPLVRHLRKLGYRGPTALTRMEVALLRALPAVVVRPAIRGRAAMIPRRHGRIRLDTGRFIRRCRALGLRVDFWVINEPSVARTLLDEGATGFVSDDPGALRHVISSAGGR